MKALPRTLARWHHPAPTHFQPTSLLKPSQNRINAARRPPSRSRNLQPVQLVVRPQQHLKHIESSGGHPCLAHTPLSI
jgi:hypothetical protein